MELPNVECREVFAERLVVLAKALEEGCPVGPEDTTEAAKGGGLECGDRGDIEQVASRERGGSMPHLLGQDLGGRFDQHGPSEYRFAAHWIRGEQAAGDEGDFAFGKVDPDCRRFLHIVDQEGADRFVQPWRDAVEQSRVAQEDIHAGTTPVAMPPHER